MSRKTVLLLGAGGHARACLDVLELDDRWTILGLAGLPEETGTSVLGYAVFGSDADIDRLFASCDHALVTVGQIKTPAVRIRLFERVEQAGRVLPPVISPRAYVSKHATVGDGTIVMHGAIVNAGARIGRNCIVNSLALIEHDATVEDHCHISTNAALNSGVHVGAGTFIGSTSVVRQGLSIGAGSVIGMGQHVRKDCPEGTRLPPARDPA